MSAGMLGSSSTISNTCSDSPLFHDSTVITQLVVYPSCLLSLLAVAFLWIRTSRRKPGIRAALSWWNYGGAILLAMMYETVWWLSWERLNTPQILYSQHSCQYAYGLRRYEPQGIHHTFYRRRSHTTASSSGPSRCATSSLHPVPAFSCRSEHKIRQDREHVRSDSRRSSPTAIPCYWESLQSIPVDT